jgi:[ribosomal protein S18]-alanine N-acetyltransferase
VGRLRAEADAQQIIASRINQRVNHGGEFLGPIGAGGEHHRAGATDCPVSGSFSYSDLAIRDPPVAKNLQLEAGRVIQIGFKCEGLFAFATQAGDPLQREGTRQQPNRDPDIFKPLSRKMQTRLQTAGSKPFRLDDPALACTRPVQCDNPSAAVITGKIKVPKAEQDSRSQCVNEDQTPHNPSDAHSAAGVQLRAILCYRYLLANSCKPAATLLYYNGSVKVILREFKREDFEILWNIDQKCFSPGISYSRLELAAYIRHRGSLTLVAESTEARSVAEESPIVGFIVAEVNRRGIGHIITIDVIAAARRIGVGSDLLGAAEHRLLAVQCPSVQLETAVDNLGALAFYKRHGYFLEKTVPHYYSNGVDALVLRKDLLPQAKSS